MCFDNDADYDWYARTQEEDRNPRAKDVRCEECLEPIPAGAPIFHIYLQQYEYCEACEEENCECVKDCCECEDPQVGETYDYYCCQNCERFLDAVEAAELEEGCSKADSRPLHAMMRAEMEGIGRKDARRYFKKALKMFPTLQTSGYLGRLWKGLFASFPRRSCRRLTEIVGTRKPDTEAP